MLVGVNPFLYCNWLEKDFCGLPWGPLLWEGSYNEPRKFHFQSCGLFLCLVPLCFSHPCMAFLYHMTYQPQINGPWEDLLDGGGGGVGAMLIRGFAGTFQLQIKRVLSRTYQTGGREGVVVRVL